MPNGTPQRIADLLSVPMAEAIVRLGESVARAQSELDRNSIATQQAINEDPLLAELGLQAPWYQMPRVELELTMAIALEEQRPQPRPTPSLVQPNVLALSRLRQIHLQPVNALYANQFNYNVNAASKLKLTIVPVPPPSSDVVASRLTREAVLAIAQPHLVNDPNARLAANFNGLGRLWFVLQYRLEQNETRRLALVVIDDETGQIVKHETSSG